jgi:hypothetical protein
LIRFTLPAILFCLNSAYAGDYTGAYAGTRAEFVLCSEFGCKTRTAVEFTSEQWRQIEQVFTRPALSPWLEKQQIRRAVALMERFSGAITGTAQDLAGNYNDADIPHQMDCIDESTNTMQYLFALDRRKLLHWHRADIKQRRRTWFIFAHWTAVIRDLSNNQLYAVDSWYEDNGRPPYLQPIESWTRAKSFPASLNPPMEQL